MSDHFRPILCTIELKQPKPTLKPTFIIRRKWKNFDKDEFRSDLANAPWGEVIDPNKDAHQQAEAFDKIIESNLSNQSHAWILQ